MKEIMQVEALKLDRRDKSRVTRFANKIKSMAGVNEDLSTSYQPERSKREDNRKKNETGNYLE